MIGIGISIPSTTQGQGGGLSSFSDDFERGDGAVGNGWVGTTGAIVSGKLVITPTYGSELVTDGNMELGTLTNWIASGTPTTREKSTNQAHGGTQSLRLIADANGEGARTSNIVSVTGQWYRFTGWLYAIGGISATFGHNIGASNISLISMAAAWTQKTLTRWELAGTNRNVRCLLNIGEAYFDDVSMKAIAASSMIITREPTQADTIAKATWTIPEGVQAGVVVNVDSVSNPQNYVCAIVNRIEAGAATLYLIKFVAGVPTEVTTGTITYSAGAAIEIRKTGTTYKAFYNDIQVSTDQTISDAGIISNTIHGAIATDPSATADGFFLGSQLTDSSVVFAGSSITAATGVSFVNRYASYPNLAYWHMRDRYLPYDWSQQIAAVAGANTYNNLWRLPTDVLAYAPNIVIFDPTNNLDNEHCDRAMEAFIRRIWTAYPNCKLLMMVFPAMPNTDNASVLVPDNAAMMVTAKGLADYYGFPYVDFWAEVYDRVVNEAEDLITYYSDGVHPNGAGHALAYVLLQPYLATLATGGRQSPLTLPTALYDINGEYQYAPQLINGTDDDSRTGTWTDNGTVAESSEVNATITYSGTFSSFALKPPSGYFNPAVSFRFNGGSWNTGTPDVDGYRIGARGAYTVEIRVNSGTVKIDKFVAI